ncbi:unnamed protein product [Cylicostephanus goldi]|uniref:Uncharacterized protein n=1 Tax=Cylicostephanus goldi TaxID=71465 RepID=A0A3P7NZ53_CYLGO|nr:unnamed protein product [Cylicostephanus goldi]
MPKDRLDIDESHKWLLHTAADKGCLDVCKMLIENGYDPRLRNDRMELPLHLAAQSNSADVVQYLLGLAPDTIDDESNLPSFTPFLTAVNYEALDTVKVLVEHGANILLIDREGRTPIMSATQHSAVDMLSVSVLC